VVVRAEAKVARVEAVVEVVVSATPIREANATVEVSADFPMMVVAVVAAVEAARVREAVVVSATPTREASATAAVTADSPTSKECQCLGHYRDCYSVSSLVHSYHFAIS
jgi:hypothetical protein